MGLRKPKAYLSRTPKNKPERRVQKSSAEFQRSQTKYWMNLVFVRDCRVTVQNPVRNPSYNPAWYNVIVLRHVGQEMLSFVIAAKRLDAGHLVESKGFQQMIDASGAARNEDMVNIQQFAKHHCSQAGHDPPLEDESWDIVLFRQWLKERDPEVYPAVHCKTRFAKQACTSIPGCFSAPVPLRV